MEQQESRLFWVSYADLMTALFIVALVLFVLSHKSFKLTEANLIGQQSSLLVEQTEHGAENEALKARIAELEAIASQQKTADKTERELQSAYQQLASLKDISEDYNKQGAELGKVREALALKERIARRLIQQLNADRQRLAVMEEEYKKLREIQRALEQLDPRYFRYQDRYKRYLLRSQVLFSKGTSEIDSRYRNELVVAGRALERMVNGLDPDDNIKYLLVIEGMASRDDYEGNYELSYERSLALYKLWQSAGIRFDPHRFELMISGSGEGGVGRDHYIEENNQRFLIQIVPKIGRLEALD